MGLITIRGDDGQSHLIHTSQICPQPFRPRPPDQWPGVWASFDAVQSRTPQVPQPFREVKKPENLKPEGGETP